MLDLARCRSTLAYALALWEKGIGSTTAKQVGGRDPVERIRRILLTCPDELPPEIDMPFIEDIEVRGGIEHVVRTAWANYRIGEWAGATVFAGAAAEAVLLWLVRARRSEEPPAGDPKMDPFNKLHLDDLIKRAAAEQWLDTATTSQLRQAQDARNLIHPGRAFRLEKECSRGTALTAFAALYLLIEDLAN